jgi:hypothetical protein
LLSSKPVSIITANSTALKALVLKVFQFQAIK